jgi:hypothetical protein
MRWEGDSLCKRVDFPSQDDLACGPAPIALGELFFRDGLLARWVVLRVIRPEDEIIYVEELSP